MLARNARAATLALALLPGAEPGEARRFYPDDPIQREPAPLDVPELKPRQINQWYDYYRNTFQDPGQGNDDAGGPFPAQSVNTLGEVLDGAWYQNRQLTHEQKVRGPGNGQNAPDFSGKWKIIRAKSEGVTPGFVVEDAQKRRYLLKFDPIDNLEMATGADVVGARLLHALGYWVPENYLVHFTRDQLVVDEKTKFTDVFGRNRRMTDRDVGEILFTVPPVSVGPNEGKIRAVASLYVPGTPLGPFKYYGRRRGDKNDFIRHEHRRELRGLHAIFAWLNHHDSRSINSLDTLVEEGGVHSVRHYLIDFGSTLGSAAIKPKSAREGNAYMYDFRSARLNFLTLGLYARDWERARYPYYSSLGRIQWDVFEPEEWVPNYRNRAFLNRQPDDNFWAAKKLMTLTDEDIRDIVATGGYTNPDAAAWLTECLIKRRDAVGRTYFAQVLPLDGFAVRGGQLEFEDLGTKYRFAPARDYRIRWARFNNDAERREDLPGTGPALPEAVRTLATGAYAVAVIDPGEGKRTVAVTLRRTASGHEVVGVERTW